jgi:hypothetical protein
MFIDPKAQVRPVDISRPVIMNLLSQEGVQIFSRVQLILNLEIINH